MVDYFLKWGYWLQNNQSSDRLALSIVCYVILPFSRKKIDLVSYGRIFLFHQTKFLGKLYAILNKSKEININHFMFNVVKWDVSTARFLNYVWSFYNIINNRVKLLLNLFYQKVYTYNWNYWNVAYAKITKAFLKKGSDQRIIN